MGFGYRITISSNSTTCLQRFEFPLNGQTFNAIGIKAKNLYT
ncbi:hypothetical protein swp_4748 [Shewanella piezotolerans WP3]|uniref:Uncharacterized protein n=1 Tax=Shewanella piezotolerans (strain WP3 / JCM 13877) TaxID=225849 RepID=B8CTY5_SHEPW|nr:hypothetical protein swp_4748 [Shewanella piezotolerans WP3]